MLRRGEARPLSLAALLAGLSLSHHLQTLYLAPAAALVVARARLRARNAALLAALVLLGLSLKPVVPTLLSVRAPSLTAPFAARVRPLVRYLTAGEYAGRFAGRSWGERLAGLWTRGLEPLVTEAGWPLALLALLGAVALARRDPGLLAGGAGVYAAAAALTSSFGIASVTYYLLPAAAFAAVCAAAGLATIRRTGVRLTLGAALVAFAAWRGRPPVPLDRWYGAHDWGRNLLDSCAPGAVLVTRHDDDLFPALYLQRVLDERADVVLVHRPYLTRLWHHAEAERLHPDVAVLDPALIPWGETVQPDELIGLFVRSHRGRRELDFSWPAESEAEAARIVLLPQGGAFRAETSAPGRPSPFAARLRGRLRRRAAFMPCPPGSRPADVTASLTRGLTRD